MMAVRVDDEEVKADLQKWMEVQAAEDEFMQAAVAEREFNPENHLQMLLNEMVGEDHSQTNGLFLLELVMVVLESTTGSQREALIQYMNEYSMLNLMRQYDPTFFTPKVARAEHIFNGGYGCLMGFNYDLVGKACSTRADTCNLEVIARHRKNASPTSCS